MGLLCFAFATEIYLSSLLIPLCTQSLSHFPHIGLITLQHVPPTLYWVDTSILFVKSIYRQIFYEVCNKTDRVLRYKPGWYMNFFNVRYLQAIWVSTTVDLNRLLKNAFCENTEKNKLIHSKHMQFVKFTLGFESSVEKVFYLIQQKSQILFTKFSLPFLASALSFCF